MGCSRPGRGNGLDRSRASALRYIGQVNLALDRRTAPRPVIIVGCHITAVGLRKTAQGCSRRILAYLTRECLNGRVAYPSAELPVPRSGARISSVRQRGDMRRRGPSWDDIPVLVHQYELIERVADIAHRVVSDIVLGIENGHPSWSTHRVRLAWWFNPSSLVYIS